jgi:hypothetical protein
VHDEEVFKFHDLVHKVIMFY